MKRICELLFTKRFADKSRVLVKREGASRDLLDKIEKISRQGVDFCAVKSSYQVGTHEDLATRYGCLEAKTLFWILSVLAAGRASREILLDALTIDVVSAIKWSGSWIPPAPTILAKMDGLELSHSLFCQPLCCALMMAVVPSCERADPPGLMGGLDRKTMIMDSLPLVLRHGHRSPAHATLTMI